MCNVHLCASAASPADPIARELAVRTLVPYVKQSQGKSFVILSGGTNHHMAAAAIGGFVRRNFPVAVVNRMDEPKTVKADLCGPLCTPTDVLARKVEIPAVEPGDLVAVLKSGAYGFSASPLEFLSHERPREVLIRDGAVRAA